MSDPIVLTVPEDIADRARQIADTTEQPIEQILLDHLNRLIPPLAALPSEYQAELDALQYLSDDALWTIAREQMPDVTQARAHILMTKNSRDMLTDEEQAELDALVDRADKLMLRKAEAAELLRKRGYAFSQKDFKPTDE